MVSVIPIIFRQFIVKGWLEALKTPQAVQESRQQTFGQDPVTLITSSTIRALRFANGSSIYHDHLFPALRAAEHEVILVTCFWAPSSSLTDLSTALLHLSHKSLARGTGEKIRVRLCFSSRSLLQKLFHTRSPRGYTYSPNTWATKLGLPGPDQLGGLDLRVKSLFFRPFSVLHSKFVIIDRRLAFMPSCNVSWEEWCECFVTIEGAFVKRLLEFWQSVWAEDISLNASNTSTISIQEATETGAFSRCSQGSNGDSHGREKSVAILLPSRHHSSLIASFPFLSHAAPSTQLNTFLLTAFAQAGRSILLLTPNFTSFPVYKALLNALADGIHVHIITNRRMMVVEQLVTAGTLTEVYNWRLVRAYRKLCKLHVQQLEGDRTGLERSLESGSPAPQLGDLKIQYFRGRHSVKTDKMHIKCSVVDDLVYVIGSGNMDRASWYTSQELGVALLGDYTAFIKDLKSDLILEDYFG